MTLTKQNNALYPGMMCKGIEFFAVEGGMNFISDNEIKCITKLPYAIIQLANEEIEKHQEVKEALTEWHPDSNFNQVAQFLKCRYGGLDFKADMQNNEFKEGDYWDCPLRATCPNNGLLCKAPKVNGKDLTSLEIKLMKLKSTTLTNDVIASELNLPLGSFHKASKILHEKLNVQTRQEVALIAKRLNLI